MPTIDITIEAELLDQLDEVATRQSLSRNEIIVVALKNYLHHLHTKALERKHKAGYLKHPQTDEVTEWEDEQSWVTWNKWWGYRFHYT